VDIRTMRGDRMGNAAADSKRQGEKFPEKFFGEIE